MQPRHVALNQNREIIFYDEEEEVPYIRLCSYLNYSLAKIILKSFQVDDFSGSLIAIAFICELVEEGHICCHIDLKDYKEEKKSIPAWFWDLLQEEVRRLYNMLPFWEIPNLYPCEPIGRYQEFIYLQKWWVLENLCVFHLLRLSHDSQIEDKISQNQIEEFLITEEGLSSEQRYAVMQALMSPLFFLCGGPGTGKTYTAAVILKAFLSLITNKTTSVILCAPTGKATTNLQAALKEFSSKTEIQIATIHSLVDWKRVPLFDDDSFHLQADLIIVDEASMIDMELMAYFLASIKKGGRIIFIGDPDQLPPVDPGTPFKDILKTSGGIISKSFLSSNFRLENRDLRLLAQLTKEGNFFEMSQLLNSHSDKISFFEESLSFTTYHYKKKWLKKLAEPFIPFCYSKDTEKNTLSQFQSYRILTHQRKGYLGVEHINEGILDAIFDYALSDDLYIPIMQSQNDYNLELMNGEIGILKLKRRSKKESFEIKEGDFVYFEFRNQEQSFVDIEKKVRAIPAIFLQNWELAFCLSIHKSQGSEFKNVVLLFCENCDNLGREIFYTGVTRAKQRLELFSNIGILEKMLKRQQTKTSNLSSKLLRPVYN